MAERRPLPPSVPAAGERKPVVWILAASTLVIAFLFWWIYGKPTGAAEGDWVTRLPAVNAFLNSLAALCLTAGWLAIRRGDWKTHRAFMVSALGFSALFLVSYLTYHHFHGDTPFPGQGWVRPVYFFILISHIVLSVVAFPLILLTVYQAATRRFDRHRRLARWTLPIWLYVSVTGVVVFFFLRAYV